MGAYYLFSINKKIVHLSKQIEHMDEELDATGSGITRLLNREKQNLPDTNADVSVNVDSQNFDFGRIEKAADPVETTFNVKNNGTQDLKIGTITTSCGCTSAKIDKTTIGSGGQAILSVTFDPNFHEEPLDRFSRSIFVPTNDPNNPELEFKIFVDIIE